MTSIHHDNAPMGRGLRRSPRPTSYRPPRNPADPEGAALDLIVRLPDPILVDDVTDPGRRREFKINVAFEGVVSEWDSAVACEITVAGGAQKCRRPARWRADSHGCERRLMCTEHKYDWLARTERALAHSGKTICGMCGKEFTAASNACTITAL